MDSKYRNSQISDDVILLDNRMNHNNTSMNPNYS